MAAVYEIRMWNNGENTTETGSQGSFEMSDDETYSQGDVIYADQATIQLRMLEALNCNLVSIAQSLERLAQIQGHAHFGF